MMTRDGLNNPSFFSDIAQDEQ